MHTQRERLKLLGVPVLGVALLVAMFLPFFPGEPDRFAVPLSMMVQAGGFVGLLLVPIGLAWWIVQGRRRGRAARTMTGGPRWRLFPTLAWCGGSLVAFAVAVSALTISVSLGTFVAMVWLFASWRFMRGLRRGDPVHGPAISPTPIYLVVLPLVLVCAHLMFFERAIDFSRRRAMENSAEFIRDIERYHSERGHYPLSLAGLHRDYKPGIVGVERYVYEPNGDAYNLFFEQFASPVGTQEIVMFNKLGEHAVYSHPNDRLEYSGEELRLRSGWYAVHDAGLPHWNYFWFD